ncbi:hypothetical protein, partial [Klebsiella quasipneumoniae]|uniref:hypothetical protein n=1 Tax=Klebsiella quasipneumoniae TaxID=1463165 RepID=UPI001C12BE55
HEQNKKITQPESDTPVNLHKHIQHIAEDLPPLRYMFGYIHLSSRNISSPGSVPEGNISRHIRYRAG